MKILVVGSGGREHALVHKLARDAPGAEIHAAPGNPGTELLARNVDVASDDVAGLVGLAESEEIDLTVVGPESPLAQGLADAFEDRGLPIFGPTRAAARIESSKAFAKRLMERQGVPTAGFRTFSQPAAAHAWVDERGAPIVVKASGLAAGKGALVCHELEAAHAAVDQILVERRFGAAGDTVVVEEFLEGDELSVFFLSDGENAALLGASRDHKRAMEGGRGPNTGGMGAYTPVEDATPVLLEEVRAKIARPVLERLAEEGAPYRGFLYAGLMLTDEGPKVVEFNCRLGDPEAQVVLPLTASGLLEPMRAVAHGESLRGWQPEGPEGAALITVLASGGYPLDYETGFPIRVPDDLDGGDTIVYHAGTGRSDGRLVTAGGRVLGVVGLGDTVREAGERSRAGAERIQFEGKHWRRDIGDPGVVG